MLFETQPTCRARATVLTSSALLGTLFGLFVYPNWQVLLLQVKILSGAVAYPAPNLPQYINLKTWNLLSQFLAVLSKQGVSDTSLSLLTSALQGMSSLTGIGLIVLAITGRPLISICIGPVFLYFGLWSGGIVYPIHLIGFHSYGIVGLDFSLLALGLFLNDMNRSAALVAGLLFSVHPSWGVWMGLTLGLYFLLNFNKLQGKAGILAWLCAGLAVSAASYVNQARLVPDMSSLAATAPDLGLTDKQYFLAVLHSWPGHRILGAPVYLHKAFFASVCGLLACIATLTRRTTLAAPPALLRFAWFYTLFFASTLVVSVGITLFPELAPNSLHILMPNRSWCLTQVLTMLMALSIGFAMLNSKHLSAFLLLSTGLLILQAHSKAHLILVLGPIMVLVLAYPRTGELKHARRLTGAAAILVLSAALWAVAHIPMSMIRGQELRYDGGEVSPMTPALEALNRDGKTVALAPSVLYYLQYRLTAPVVFSNEIYAAPYARSILPYIDAVAEEINGEGFVRPYLEQRKARQDLFSVWQARKSSEWRTIMDKYGIDRILVRAGESLDLPLMMEDSSYRIYLRPGSIAADRAAP